MWMEIVLVSKTVCTFHTLFFVFRSAANWTWRIILSCQFRVLAVKNKILFAAIRRRRSFDANFIGGGRGSFSPVNAWFCFNIPNRAIEILFEKIKPNSSSGEIQLNDIRLTLLAQQRISMLISKIVPTYPKYPVLSGSDDQCLSLPTQ